MDKKRAYLFCKFLQTEMKTINEAKWYEGEKRNADPGPNYIIEWINKNAEQWRKEWEISKCQHCAFWMYCGHNLKKDCEDFQLDKNEEEFL
jgi:hypothetical protein